MTPLSQRENWWVGRDSNPRPTPKAFGAALSNERLRLLTQEVQSELRILLLFQLAFQRSRFGQRPNLEARGELQSSAKAFGCMGVTSLMLIQTPGEIRSRADVIPSGSAFKDVDPRHIST